ncbi:MAG: diaminopimelate decarboxylase [Candidatus Caenarcaniphilales bacterium]|nr:diaminopimelate decarboxylase [Candidatus Caenarcaniphilales bacterium]
MNPSYFPNSAKINSSNHLEVGGYDLTELAERFGTPLYVIDERTVRDTAKEYKEALNEFYPNSLPIFASKALSLQAIFSILYQEGFGLDVVSAGELFTAQSIKFPGEKIYLHGNNKSMEELEMASDYEGTKVIIDNFNDIEILRKLGKPIDALLRLTPGVECHTHEYIKTGHLDSKFGFDLDQLEDAIEKIKSISNINLIGLHAHIGSQIFEIAPYQDAAKILLGSFVKLKEKYGLEFSELNVGGGFGIHYTEQDDPPSINDVIKKLSETVKSLVSEFKLKEPKLIIEPGRSIVGRAGVTVYTVGASKEVPEGSYYISVDGGMADNPRSITYQAEYEACLANRVQSDNLKKYTLAGRYCESGDILIKDLELPVDVQSGDLIAVFGTGAYNYSMSSNYNRVPKPTMVLLNNGEAEVILRKETLEDILRNDILPTRLANLKEKVH